MDMYNVDLIPKGSLVVSTTKTGGIIISNKDAEIHLLVMETPKGLMIEIVGAGYIELGPHGEISDPAGRKNDIGPAVNAFVKK